MTKKLNHFISEFQFKREQILQIKNEGYKEGIQKAIDVVNNFEFVKLIHLGITGTVFNGYSKEEKEAAKIVQDNLLEKLNQEVKNGK